MSDHQHTFSRDRLVQKFGEQPFSLVFSGQGFNWLKTLREAVAAGAGFNVNSIVERAASLTEPVADELTAARPFGFDPVDWASNDDDPAFDIFTSHGTNFLEHSATFTDDNSFLAVTLDHNSCSDMNFIGFLISFHRINHYCN